jgi:RNA polymerase subunit RPABC4/transcription elongation factor Spt4
MAQKIIGKGMAEIPRDRQVFVIQIIGQSFKDNYHALRQYLDNAKDSIEKRKKYDPSFRPSDNAIYVSIDRDARSIRVADTGLGITPEKPIYETPRGEYILSSDGQKIPYINSFEKMAKNLLNSIKRFEKDYQSGQNASGMLAFMKLGCEKVSFIVKNRNDGKIFTYTLNQDGSYLMEEGGDKEFEEPGVEILLAGIDKRTLDNWFNPHAFQDYLQQTYHQDILMGNVNIFLKYSAEEHKGKGRQKAQPMIQIEPMAIAGNRFEPTQIKTKNGKLIHINIMISEKPRSNPFVLINCRGTGGVPAKDILFNDAVWKNEYLQGFITADFLNFSGNDKSSFLPDAELKSFQLAIEEQIEDLLFKKISEVKKKRTEGRMKAILDDLKYALYRTLKNQGIMIEGVVSRTKKCPKCETILPYNQQTCPVCGFKFPTHTKICKYCGAEIPLAAKVCPNCGKDLIDTMKCPNCGKEIPKLSFICPYCKFELRQRKEPQGKSPDISEQSLGAENPRSQCDVEDEKLIAIKINIDHKDYIKAMGENYLEVYLLPLVAKEVAKFAFQKGTSDYTDKMIDILIGMFNELKAVGAIEYKEEHAGHFR